uniref:Large ribosomal subunit protein mL64 n=1 Tax=Strongyloides venezuelensis TaxID=75913 RepID=A0A0K0G157_STRVS
MSLFVRSSKLTRIFVGKSYCHTSINEKTIIGTKLNPRHKNIAEGKINPIQYDWEKEVSQLRERFGTYGLASGVDLSHLWPTVEEINEIQACKMYSPFKDVLEMAKLEGEKKEKELNERMKTLEENEKMYSEKASEK